MPLVAGVDSSTQSVKVVLRDADSGAWVRKARATHPDGTSVDPAAWVSALDSAMEGLLNEVIRPALLWNDTRSAADATALVDELGGPEAWASAVGSVPVAAFTVSQVRWLARNEPENARRVASLMLPHDYLTWHRRQHWCSTCARQSLCHRREKDRGNTVVRGVLTL